MEREPKLLEAFLRYGDVSGLDKATKAALRLCNHQIKKVIDATVISCTLKLRKRSDVALLSGSDWKLKKLTIEEYRDAWPLEVLPNAFFKKFPLLETLKFIECTQLEALPENIGELIHLTDFTIVESNLTTLSPSLGQLTALELYNCWNMTLEGLAPLKQLEQLKILKVGLIVGHLRDPSPEWICDNITTGLLELRLGNSAHSLPSKISNFKHLTCLILAESCLRELPESIGLLSSLQKLAVSNHNPYRVIPLRLPNSFSQLATLEELDVDVHLEGIAPLQHLTGVTNLELRLYYEGNLQYLDFIWNMTGLKRLYLKADSSIRQIEQVYSLRSDISNLKNLESLHLEKLRDLYELPESIGTLSCLTALYIWSLPELRSLPDSIGNLKGLKILSMGNCANQLPPSIGDLDSLEVLWLTDFKKLTELPDTIGKLNALKVFSIRGCHELTAIPESFADLVLGKDDENWSLEEVVIDCNNLVLSPKMKQAMELLRSRRVLVED
jgi:leucine-rich repeat protein SHOC2